MSKRALPLRAAGRSVLIVEDDPRLREMLVRAVRDMSSTVEAAGSAELACRAFVEHPYDVVLLDLNLPGAGGIELLKMMRLDNNPAEVIILTGFGDLESARAALHYEAVEFLTKPCPIGILEQALAKAFQRRLKAAPTTEKPGAADEPASSETDRTTPTSLAEIEREHIRAVLARHDGNRNATAVELGISVRTLYYRLDQYHRDGSPR